MKKHSQMKWYLPAGRGEEESNEVKKARRSES
jgi:hypothetical protein